MRLAFAATFAWTLVAFLALWLVSLRRRDASIVDVFWGPGFVGIALVALALSESRSPRRWLALALVALWGLRLGAHLFRRNRGRGEDFRYRAMRRHHGERFALVSLASVFGLQALLQWIVSLPLQLAILAPGPTRLGVWDAVGVGLFAVGLGFEAVGDLQLARFKADPANAGRVLDRGLWRFTRHPNYFGDCVVWWGFQALALAAPGGAWTVVGPLVMTVLLRRVSGVTLLERHLARSRPGYADYVARTSPFLPRPPRPTAPGRSSGGG
jgi:steroid 5-alpha reductase family enzyme